MKRMPRKTSPSRLSSFSISEASRLLGVSDTSLRHWTDEGNIRAFVTPGGHRRYSETELRRFMASHQGTRNVKDLVAELEDTASHHREIAQLYLSPTQGHLKLSKQAQVHLAEAGRRLLDLVIQYVTRPPKRGETMEVVQNIGRDFGATLAKDGFSLVDSLEAFMNHRNLLVKAATDLARKRSLVSKRTVEAIPLVTRIMDEALVSLVAAHQGNGGTPQTGGRESSQ